MEQDHKAPSKFKRFIKETMRVMHILKKPGKTEFLSLLKVTGLGVAIIGLIGFVLFLFKQLFL
jgi:protein transport protein SEC61 subunit gamma and related proteins